MLFTQCYLYLQYSKDFLYLFNSARNFMHLSSFRSLFSVVYEDDDRKHKKEKKDYILLERLKYTVNTFLHSFLPIFDVFKKKKNEKNFIFNIAQLTSFK